MIVRIPIAPFQEVNMPYIVLAVVGKVLRVRDADKEDDGSALEFTIAKRAEIIINDKKMGLADLANGDVVEIANGNIEGYHKVIATRDPNAPAVVAISRDLSKPREVQRVDPNEVNSRQIFTQVPSTIPAAPLDDSENVGERETRAAHVDRGGNPVIKHTEQPPARGVHDDGHGHNDERGIGTTEAREEASSEGAGKPDGEATTGTDATAERDFVNKGEGETHSAKVPGATPTPHGKGPGEKHAKDKGKR